MTCQSVLPPNFFLRLKKKLKDFFCRFRDGCSRAKDGAGFMFVQEIVVFRRDDATADDLDIFAAVFPEGINQLWQERLVSGS